MIRFFMCPAAGTLKGWTRCIDGFFRIWAQRCWLPSWPLRRRVPSAQELRVLVHGSFSLPKPLLAKFESEAGVKLSIIKGGDAGEMLNKLILTRAQPIADVVFGIDNALVAKAQAADVLDPTTARRPAHAGGAPGARLVPVDYGYVTLNYDRAWFAKSGLALPRSLEDLAQPAYRNLLAVQNPATSSPGICLPAGDHRRPGRAGCLRLVGAACGPTA
jgi:ABC transporter substrate-binding protein (ThiB subfamily)